MLTLPLNVDRLGQCVQVKGEEHLEGVRLAVVGHVGELGLSILLEMVGQREKLLVESSLLGSGEKLPCGGVGERLMVRL